MSEVDEVKLEIKALKERVDKLEDHIKNHEQHNHHSH
jgi:polyhydroxyalkanoate synthesis regulator phasin